MKVAGMGGVGRVEGRGGGVYISVGAWMDPMGFSFSFSFV